MEHSAISETAIIQVLEATHPVSIEEIAIVSEGAVAQLRKLKIPGETDLYAKLAKAFRTASTESLGALAGALERGDMRGAAAVCHKLKSSTANIGALVFSREVRHLERLCLDADMLSALKVLSRLQLAHPQLLQNINTAVSQKNPA